MNNWPEQEIAIREALAKILGKSCDKFILLTLEPERQGNYYSDVSYPTGVMMLESAKFALLADVLGYPVKQSLEEFEAMLERMTQSAREPKGD